MGAWSHYQLAFRTPGIIPDSANSRKQMRQMPKRRRYARERPQREQRFFARTWNFGFRFAFSSNDFGGTYLPPFLSSVVLNGMPSSFSSASAWSSRCAVVTIVMSIPWIISMSS
jgi:hypothetical protein